MKKQNFTRNYRGEFSYVKKKSEISGGEVKIVHLYLEQGKSISILTKAFEVNGDTIRNWIRKYQTEGVEGLKESHSWKKYTLELKEKAVTDYLTGRCSLSRSNFHSFYFNP